MWGGASAFFDLFDQAYKEEIDAMLLKILSQMSFTNTSDTSLDAWMTKYFYYVQQYYPAVAYNYTARLAYEAAQLFYDNRALINSDWANNN